MTPNKRRNSTSRPARARSRAARSEARRPADTMAMRSIFPVWAPPLVMFAVFATGLVLGLNAQHVPTTFFVLFALAAVVCTLLVEARGLFLTIAALPLYYVIGAAAIGIIAAPSSSSSNGRKATLIASVYPLIEHYFWLLIPFIICLGIGLFRWWLYRDELSRRQARDDFARRRRARAESTNRDNYQRARARSGVGFGEDSASLATGDVARPQERRLSAKAAEATSRAEVHSAVDATAQRPETSVPPAYREGYAYGEDAPVRPLYPNQAPPRVQRPAAATQHPTAATQRPATASERSSEGSRRAAEQARRTTARREVRFLPQDNTANPITPPTRPATPPQRQPEPQPEVTTYEQVRPTPVRPTSPAPQHTARPVETTPAGTTARRREMPLPTSDTSAATRRQPAPERPRRSARHAFGDDTVSHANRPTPNPHSPTGGAARPDPRIIDAPTLEELRARTRRRRASLPPRRTSPEDYLDAQAPQRPRRTFDDH